MTPDVEFAKTNTLQPRAFLLWNSSPQKKAAEARLNLLLQIKDQPSQIDGEFENIRASINWLESREDVSASYLLLTYIETLENYLRLRGKDFELVNWCITGLDICEELKRNPERITLILGNAQYAVGKWEDAEASWQATSEVSRENDPVIHAHAISAIGRLQMNQGKYKVALKTLAHAENLLKAINDIQALVGVRSEIAAYYLNRRELDKALKLYLEIDEFYKNSGANNPSNQITLVLGVIYRQKRIFDKAIEYFSELSSRSEAQKDLSALATSTHHMAWVYFELRNLKKARYLCGKALSIYEEIQDPRGLSDAQEQLGAILIEEGRIEEAIILLDQSVQIRQQLANDTGEISSLRRLALAYALNGNRKNAIQLILQVLKRYQQSGLLGRHRIFALAKDFITGASIVILQRFINISSDSEKAGDTNMKSFGKALMRSKK